MTFRKIEVPRIELKNKTGKDYITVEFDTDQDWVSSNWKGELSKKDVVEGATLVLEVIRRSCSCKLLNDNREVVGSWEEANGWIENEWTPSAIRLGLKYFAHVLSPEIYASISAEKMHMVSKGKFEMKLFSKMEDAKVWLASSKIS